MSSAPEFRGFLGDNRWLPARRESVCWACSVALQAPGTRLGTDSGNNRVRLQSLASDWRRAP